MRFVRVALSALGGVVLAASSAFAADIAAIPPPPVWGWYFGGGGCYDWADFDIEKTVYKKHRGEWKKKEHKSFEGDAQAWCGTVQVGYDFQIDPNWLVGLFASYDWQDKRGDITETKHRKLEDIGDVWLGNIATVGGRAGMIINQKTLVYALLGWSWTDGGVKLYSHTLSGDLNGPTVGAGFEKFLTNNITARLEYRLTDFGSLSKIFANNCEKKDVTASIMDQSVRLVLAYRP